MEPLTEAETLALLASCLTAHIGVIDGETPYVSPMSFVLDGHTLAFRTGAGRRLEAIKASPRVCVEASQYVDENGAWESAIAWGMASVVVDNELKNSVVQRLLSKYEDLIGSPLAFSAWQPVGGSPIVVAVEIDEVSGLSSGRGFSPRTRPGRL